MAGVTSNKIHNYFVDPQQSQTQQGCELFNVHICNFAKWTVLLNIVAHMSHCAKIFCPVNFCLSRNIDLINNMIVSIDKHPLMLQLVILLSIKIHFLTPIWQLHCKFWVDTYYLVGKDHIMITDKYFQMMQNHNLLNAD